MDVNKDYYPPQFLTFLLKCLTTFNLFTRQTLHRQITSVQNNLAKKILQSWVHTQIAWQIQSKFIWQLLLHFNYLQTLKNHDIFALRQLTAFLWSRLKMHSLIIQEKYTLVAIEVQIFTRGHRKDKTLCMISMASRRRLEAAHLSRDVHMPTSSELKIRRANITIHLWIILNFCREVCSDHLCPFNTAKYRRLANQPIEGTGWLRLCFNLWHEISLAEWYEIRTELVDWR